VVCETRYQNGPIVGHFELPRPIIPPLKTSQNGILVPTLLRVIFVFCFVLHLVIWLLQFNWSFGCCNLIGHLAVAIYLVIWLLQFNWSFGCCNLIGHLAVAI
jgi:hypothetical protein